MADASVGIKLSAAEYRFLRNELELLAKDLQQRQRAAGGKEKVDLRQREGQLRLMLERL